MNQARQIQIEVQAQQPQIGDTVRSFDFPEFRALSGERACYVEGRISNIVHAQGCDRYEIEVSKRVWSGEEIEIATHEQKVYPPINGLEQLFSESLTNAVEVIAAPHAACKDFDSMCSECREEYETYLDEKAELDAIQQAYEASVIDR